MLASVVSDRVDRAMQFFRKEYGQRQLFEDCLYWVHQDLMNAPSSGLDALERVWMFPWQQAMYELHDALDHALLAHYKAAYDNLRRGLELSIVGIYFLQERICEQAGREWIAADRQTPMFSRAVASICQAPRFQKVNQASDWSTLIKEFYWSLSDIIHVKGNTGSFESVQPTQLIRSGIRQRQFSSENLSAVLDSWVKTVQHVGTALVLENPILIIGLDLFRKFGFNPPMSGFSEIRQAERLRGILLPEVTDELNRMVGNDEEVRLIVQAIEEMPDLTDQELEAQWRKWEALIDPVHVNLPVGADEDPGERMLDGES